MAQDPKSKKEWDKLNTVMVSIKFQKKGDSDIIDYLECHSSKDYPKPQIIRAALREYMENHRNDSLDN